ncbi:MAG: UDP-N-acetylmuramate--L-alanine ligase [Patescibacteria group bacterium]
MKQPKSYFLVGIGGIGMQAVARLLSKTGNRVAGSDMTDFEARPDLETEGITVFVGHDASHITKDIDEVLYSAAIPENNPEIQQAQKLGIPTRRRLEVIGELMKEKIGIAISGTHGKTTTTTMIAIILRAAGREPTALIGAEVRTMKSNFMMGSGSALVVEACEYGRSFMDLRPKIIVLTNIEADHLDYYKDMEDIKQAFVDFVKLLPKDGVVIGNGDDANVREVVGRAKPPRVVWAGFGGDNLIQAKNLEFVEGSLYFSMNGSRLHLHVPGRHNVHNAVLAWAVARELGIDDATVEHALHDEFKGAARRFEILGTTKGITFMDDYAHHPTEIRALLEGARQYFQNRRLIVVFHPHQYSRTRLLMNDFAESFKDTDMVIVAPIYAVRDTDDDKKSVNSEQLVSAINAISHNAQYVGDFPEIKDFVMQNIRSGDVVITLGAGQADVLGRELLEELRKSK